MATLSGNKIKDTYQSLVKFSDNGNITVGAKQLTDGFGNNSPIFVSTTQVGIGVTPESGLNLHVYGDAKIGSNLTVIGNLVVEGSTTTVGTDTLTVKDPLIVLANNNTSTDAVDIGFYGKYTPSGTTLYSGLFREALTGKYRLFKDLQEEPTTTVNTSGTGYAVASLVANLEGNVTGNLTGSVTGGSISGTTGLFTDNVNIAGTLVIDDELTIEGSAFGRIEIGGASGGYIDLKAPNSDDYDFRIISSSGGNEITTATGDLIFNTAETLALTIDTSQDATFEGGVTANSFSGNLTATSVLADGVTATTQSDGDNSTKVATTAYVDTAIEGHDTLAEVLSGGNTTGGTDIAITAGDKITNFTSTGIDDNATSTVLTIDNTNRALFSGDVSLQANLIGNTNATGDLTILGSLFVGDYGVNDDPDYLYADNNIVRIGYYSNAKQFEVNNSDFKVTATHKVGIGTNDPQTLLEVSNENIGTTTSPIIRLNNVDSSLSDGQNLGSIEFYNDHTSSTTANIGVFHNTDATIVKEMKFNLGSPYGDILTLDTNEINATKRFTITGSGSTPRVTLANNAGEGAFTYSLRSQDNGTFGIFKQNSEILGINLDDEVFINLEDDGKFSIVSATDEAAYLDFSDGSGLKNFIRVDHDGDIMGFNAWGYHLFSLGEGVPSLTLTGAAATVHGNLIVEGYVVIGDDGFIGENVTVSNSLHIGCDTNDSLRFGHLIPVEGGYSSDLVIDSLGNVGIGENSPDTILHISDGNTSNPSTDAPVIRLENTSVNCSNLYEDGDVIGGLEFYNDSIICTDIVYAAGVNAYVRAVHDGSNSPTPTSSLEFGTGTATTVSTRMTIDTSGNVGIGTTTPDTLLNLEETDTNSVQLVIDNNNTSDAGTETSTIRFRHYRSYVAGLNDAGEITVGKEEAWDASGDRNSYMSFSTRLGANGVQERMRIDSSGNVGIGVTPESWATVGDTKAIQISTGGALWEAYNGVFLSNNIYFDGDNKYIASQAAARLSLSSTGELQFFNAPSGTADTTVPLVERMRITSGGDVLIGNTTVPANGSGGSAFVDSSVDRKYLKLSSSSDASVGLVYFDNTNGTVGNISTTGSATVYNTSSDYRLKENVVEMTGALDRVSQLKPSRFNFKADADKTVDGFLAHEVQDIVPEAITGEKDAMQDEEYEITPAKYKTVVHPAEDAVYETIEHPAIEEELDDEGNIIVEGKEAYTEEVLVTEAKEEWTEKVLVSEKVMGTREVPDYQGIDQSKLVPLLVGAIQELKAEIESLKLQINN
jgi:hypothetical protein